MNFYIKTPIVFAASFLLALPRGHAMEKSEVSSQFSDNPDQFQNTQMIEKYIRKPRKRATKQEGAAPNTHRNRHYCLQIIEDYHPLRERPPSVNGFLLKSFASIDAYDLQHIEKPELTDPLGMSLLFPTSKIPRHKAHVKKNVDSSHSPG